MVRSNLPFEERRARCRSILAEETEKNEQTSRNHASGTNHEENGNADRSVEVSWCGVVEVG